MVKKLLLIALAASVIAACGDGKKKKEEQKPEAPKFASVEMLAKNADSLVNLSEATIVGKLIGVCPVSKELTLAGKGGVKVKVVPAQGVAVDSTIYGKMIAVTGKISVETLDSATIATMTAKMEELKANCEKDGKCAKHEKKDGKPCKKDGGECKEGCKEGPKMPQVGDKVYSIAASKIEVLKGKDCDKDCKDKCKGDCKDGAKEGCCKDGKAECSGPCGDKNCCKSGKDCKGECKKDADKK